MTTTLTQNTPEAQTRPAATNNSYDEAALEEIFLAIRCGTAADVAKDAGLPAQGAVVTFPTVIWGPPTACSTGRRAFPMTGPGGAPLAIEPGSVFRPGVTSIDWEVVEKKDGSGWKLTGTFAVVVGDIEVTPAAASMKIHLAETTPAKVTDALRSIAPPPNVTAPVADETEMGRRVRELVKAREAAEGVGLIDATAGWVLDQTGRLQGPIAAADPALDREEFMADLLAWLLVAARKFGSPYRPTNALWSRHLAVSGQRDAARLLHRAAAVRTGTTQVTQEIRLRLKQAPPEVQAGTVDDVRSWRALCLAATRVMRDRPGLTRSEAAEIAAADPDHGACDWSDGAIEDALSDSPQFAAAPVADRDGDRGSLEDLFGGGPDQSVEEIGGVDDIIERLVAASDGRLAPSDAALLLVLGPNSNKEIGTSVAWSEVPAGLQGTVEKWRKKAALLDDRSARQNDQRNAAAAMNAERRRILSALTSAVEETAGRPGEDRGWALLSYRGGGLRTSEEITAARRAIRAAELPAAQPWGYAELADRSWLAQRYVDDGVTQAAIAAELGCHQQSVSKALARHGIPARRTELADRSWLAQRYVDDGATQAAIAAELGCHQQSVSKALARHGIPARRTRRAAS